MQLHIATHARYLALSAALASALALMGVSGGFTVLGRLGDAVLESYTQAVSDWGQHITDKLDPTRPRCF